MPIGDFHPPLTARQRTLSGLVLRHRRVVTKRRGALGAAAEAAQGEQAGDPAVGLVGRVELLAPRRSSPAAPCRVELAHQLQVGEVAGGQRVEIAATVQRQALDRPGTDLGDREQAAIAGRRTGVAASGGHLPGGLDQGERPLRREVKPRELGRSEPGDLSRGRGRRAAGAPVPGIRIRCPSAQRSGAGSPRPARTRSAAR